MRARLAQLMRARRRSASAAAVTFCTVAAVASLLGCSPAVERTESAVVEDVFTPSDAQEVIDGAVGEVKQRSFVVERAYPTLVVDAKSLSRAQAVGWRICTMPRQGWDAFVDRARRPPSLVHQRVLVFSRGGELRIVSSRYVSALGQQEPVTSIAPQSERQQVVVMSLRLSDASAGPLMDAFQANCD
jgi:hypothetical protein